MQTLELENQYRGACQRMLASLDHRAASNAVTGEIARMHSELVTEGAQILAEPANEAALGRYRQTIEALMAKFDERDRLRAKDVFKDALKDLLNLGELLGYARNGGASKKPAIAVAEKPVAPPNPLTDVERELAQLQSQLESLHGV